MPSTTGLIAFFCVVVIRGGKNAEVVEVTSSIPVGLAVPMPTLPVLPTTIDSFGAELSTATMQWS